jgi:Leucine-rich repeat (LRR) protein
MNPPNAFNKNLLKSCNIALNLVNKASLQFLNISSNKFKRFPEELRQFPNLKSLKLDHNLIKTLPQWLGSSFKSLEILSVSDNLLQDLSFMDSNELKGSLGVSLRFLDVSFNHIDHIPIQIQHLKDLKALRLHNNDFLCIPTSIRNITNHFRLVQIHQNR